MSRVCLLSLAALLVCAHAYEEPKGKPTGITDDEDAAIMVTGELGNPFHVHCLASQYPTLFVFWYRGHGRTKLLYNDSEYGIGGNALLIRNLTIETLGQYTCQAYNAEGMVAPRFLIVRAYMPDEVFIANEWLVQRDTATTPEDLGQLFTDEPGAFEGGIATLRCPLDVPWLHGNPPPKITWKFGQLTIDGNTSRYRLMSDGALEIVPLYRNDTGAYICVADNGLGVATQEIHLAVNDPVRMPARIAGDEDATVTGELDGPLHLRCLAYGYPAPFVFWYRGYEEATVLYNDVEYEIRGNDLIFRSLRIDTLGQYTCRAYNGVGKVASWGVAVRAYMPEGLFIEHEWLVPRSAVAARPRTQPSTNATTTTTTTEAPRPLFTETTTTGEIIETLEETMGSFEAHEQSTTNADSFDVIGTTTLDPCKAFEFGCCADNETKASGPDGQGCPCYATEFGCCPDLLSPAAGRENKGCCRLSIYGCCQDDKTPAHGPDFEGCCLLQPFDCCPDNRKPAGGAHFEGCECQYTLHGCCPDKVTDAKGPDNQGCGCQYTPHGCCPDKHTAASGPNYEDCACNTYQFGCCADGVTIAEGPEQGGCHCHESKFGCCGDGETHATGPDAAGCDCSSSRHGCCPDGRSEAAGSKFLGCTHAPENKQAACSMLPDRGPCHNFTPMWYFDRDQYGGCTRFWYGGCDGNGNRFATREECADVCVQPSPKDVCKLPSVKGACDDDYQRWHYNSTREQCILFRYGGCLGNANNFKSQELCQKQCEHSSVTGQCNLPIDKGSCAGNYSRWGFNSEGHRCEQFIWGGCEGNSNRFSTKAACHMRCAGTQKPQCTQPQEAGNCTDKEALWSFSQSENRCLPFYYSGCGGNDNRFRSRETCERTCPSAYVPDKCTLPAETGECSYYRERWFYDTTFKRCRQFYYGGCGGNDNNFATEAECDNSCLEIITTTARSVEPQPQPRPAEPESGNAASERSDVPAAPLALPQQEPEVLASEGGTATLRCLFHGNPPPMITWRFEEFNIDGNAGRYRLLSDGALEIVPLYRNDTGVYMCVAENDLGVATQEIHLAVNDPMKIPVGIAGDADTVVIGELGRPLHVRCLAYGYPPPFVFWYHGSEGIMMLYNDAVYEARGNVLLIRRLALETLGQYTCKAYNGEGKAASWVVFIRAYMPEGLFIENELLVPRDPVMVSRPKTQPPTTAETTTSTTTEAPRPLFTVPVSTHVSLSIVTLNIGADLRLTCAVDGFPVPDVHWTKDGGTIHMDDRITITGSTYVSRLKVTRVTVSDSGLYACHASNQYSSQSDTAQINVQQIVVPAKCTDNVWFANCDLIVQGKICKHKYYSKFCCKSCVEAGQLNPQETEV